MTKRAGKLLTVLVVATLGLWGCAKGPANSNGHADKSERWKANGQARRRLSSGGGHADDARKKAATLDEESKRLQKLLDAQKGQLQKQQEANQLLTKQRDELRQQIDSPPTNAISFQGRCDRLKKGLQDLLGQDAAYAGTPTPNCAHGSGVGKLIFVSCQLSVVSCQLSVVSCQLSVVSCQLSVVSCQLSVVSCQLSVVLIPVSG